MATFTPYDGPEPTALAYTPDRLLDAATEPDFTHEETYLLALESIERWGGNYRLSPAMRLRAIRAVVQAALSDQSV